MNNWQSRIPNRYLAYFALSIWAALSFMLLHKTSYGIDEGAAHALLLVWSVSDNVVSPIVTLGLPDFRTLFLAPVGILWTGNILAAKIVTMLVMAIAAWAFHTWRMRSGHAESALLATGLLLISPLAIAQIDTISVAPYLLFAFAVGAWADQLYRESKRAFGGLYFSQILLCLISVTLHPAGLAYPLALLWSWYKSPLDQKHRTYFFGGIAFAVLSALALTSGWNHIEWFANPVRSLSSTLLGSAEGDAFGAFHWICGIGMLFVLVAVVLKQAGNLWSDFLGRILIFALVIGLLTGDETFGIVALVICLYWGFPILLQRSTNPQSGFWGQRGIILLLSVVISTTYMVIGKENYRLLPMDYLSPRDTLIKALAEDSGFFSNGDSNQIPATKNPIRVASQWPSLTMLACRCDALPLPPDAQNSEALLAMLRGIDYLIFDPRNPSNSSLSHNLALMDAGKVETLALQLGGVIVQIKHPANTIAPDKKT
jgi:hypothetical protein